MNFTCEPITTYELITLIVAIGAFLVGVGTICIAKTTNETNKRIAKRQNVVDLHNAWAVVNDFDKKKPISPDVIKAINAVSLTASLWNHDVLEKNLLYQSYWGSYCDIVDKLKDMHEIIPSHKFTGKSRVTNDILKAYRGMESMDLSNVKSTKL